MLKQKLPVIRLTLKSILILSFVAGALITGACATDLGVKVYISMVDKGGLWRAQDKELVKYQDSNGYFCVNEGDMRKLAEAYKTCKDVTPKPNP